MTTATFTGEIHPFLKDLPVFDEEVDRIAESIAEVGLLHPITLDIDGRIIGGRHRLAACEKINVEPEFEVFDGDVLDFMLNDNDARKHQSTGQRAAENALTLDAAGKREEGRWTNKGGRGNKGDGIPSGLNKNTWRDAMSQAGVIIDFLGRGALGPVTEGVTALSAQYDAAIQARDRERKKLEHEQRLAAEEADSKTFIEENAPDLAQQVGSVFQSYVEAHDVWKRRNREEAEKLRREQEAERRAAAERKRSLTEMYSDHIGTALMTLGSRGERENPAEVMDNFNTSLLNPPQMERYYSLENLQSARKFIDALIEWRQAQ